MYQYVKGDVLILRTYPGMGPLYLVRDDEGWTKQVLILDAKESY